MKKMKNLFMISLCLVFSFQLSAQDFTAPKDLKLKTEKDYRNHERDVVNAVDWLIATPVGEQTEKRKATNAFLIEWISGSPYMTVEISGDLVTFLDCGECLSIYMGAWVKQALIKKDYDNKLAGNIAGIEAVIAFHQKNKESMGKNKAIQKYIKQQEKGELEKYIASKL